MENERKQSVGVSLTPSIINVLDKYAYAENISSRSEFIRKLILEGLEKRKPKTATRV